MWPAAAWRCMPKFHAATVCMAGVENSAVHTLGGSTFFSDMYSTTLWRAAVGLHLLSGQNMHCFRLNKNVTLSNCLIILA